MQRELGVLFSAGLLCFALFWGLFSALQNQTFFDDTLGTIAHSYERANTETGFKISENSTPYVEVTQDKYLRWDAELFSFIRDRNYVFEEEFRGEVRSAFFPLFPFLWKTTGLSPRGVSALNYFIFILSMALLFAYLQPKAPIKNNLKLPFFIVLITLPTTIIYHIPYSESLFMLCMTIVVIGILKEKYGLYFFGALLLAMVRPATVFVLISLLAIEVFRFLSNRDTNSLIKNSILRGSPFVMGYLLVFFIQWATSGSWTSFFDAHLMWASGLPENSGITDWSVEGYGMNVFSIFFIAIPACVLSGKIIWENRGNKMANRDYLLLSSLLYISGILIFTILTSNGNIHSLFRFIMASPLFYIVAIVLFYDFEKFKPTSIKLNTIFIASSISMLAFVVLVSYGGSVFQFKYLGMLLLMGYTFFAINYKRLNRPFRVVVLCALTLTSTVWNTYLLNMMFCNGWTFT
jgi:hypothetical protein